MASHSDAAILHARMDSQRLPGKALLDLRGRSLIGRALDRARRIRRVSRVVLATSARDVDDPLARFAEAEGLDLYRGEIDDLPGRCLACATAFGIGRFARICGDSPFLDPALFDLAFDLLDASGADLVSNTVVRTFPKGLSVEVAPVETLARIVDETADPLERSELMMRYVYRSPDRFRIVSFTSGASGWGEASLAVDTPDDYRRALDLAARHPAAAEATTRELMALLGSKDPVPA